MSKRLDELSMRYLKDYPAILKNRKGTFKLMCINRNRKVVFVELTKYELERNFLFSCILPEDLFILAIFNDKNKVLDLDTFDYVDLSLKEVYFYGYELHDLDWIYEGDFRNKDSFFKFPLQYFE